MFLASHSYVVDLLVQSQLSVVAVSARVNVTGGRKEHGVVLSTGDGGDVFSTQLCYDGRLSDHAAIETLSELSVDASSPRVDVSGGGETGGVRSSTGDRENGDVFHR